MAFKSKISSTVPHLKAHRLRDGVEQTRAQSCTSVPKVGLVSGGPQPRTAGLPKAHVLLQSLIFAKLLFLHHLTVSKQASKQTALSST